MTIKYKELDVNSLIPYARNSRTHSEQQIGKIAASIREFGFLNPVIIDGDNGIIAGHGRVLAAQKLGMETVPVIEASHLTEAQRRAYVIADNRLALDAGWDDELLRVEFAELEGLGFDLELTGFDANEMARILDNEFFEENDKELKQQEYSEVFAIVVDCKDEQEQEQLFNRLDTEGYKCRVQSL